MREWMNTVFCGAFDGETDFLAKIQGLNILNVGVGLHESMYNIHKYVLKNDHIKSILFVGSAGAYPHSGLEMGDFVYSYKFINKDLVDIKKYGKVPDVVTKHLLCKTDQKVLNMAKALQLKEIVSNSMNYITLVDLSSEEIVDSIFEAGVENMEAFSLAYVANKLGLACTAIYAITNIVGANGSNDWASNWRNASNELQKRIIKFLAKK